MHSVTHTYAPQPQIILLISNIAPIVAILLPKENTEQCHISIVLRSFIPMTQS